MTGGARAVALLFGLSALACVKSASPRIPASTASVPSDVDTSFDVGGHRLSLECAGKGSPAIILQNGQGVDKRSWNAVWPALSQASRVCRYDRAGTGGSTTGPYPTSAGHIIDELHSLLAEARVSPPYLLVGHSFGGLAARMYAMKFRRDVSALLLIESASEFYDRSFDSTHINVDTFANAEERREFLDLADELQYFGRHPATSSEGIDWALSYKQLGELPRGTLTTLPLYVLSAQDRRWTSPPIFARDVRERIAAIWAFAQDSLAALSPRSTHVFAERAGHFVQQDRPDLVIDAVQALLTSARRPTNP
jgi:pimeloyl-ACP methyl ester carboxylesterase